MKLWSVAKVLLLATALVAGLALSACEASDSAPDGSGGGGGNGQDVSGGGGGGDTTVPLADTVNGGGADGSDTSGIGGDDSETPNCSCIGRECGNDGCGGSCGECGTGEECNAAGLCVPEGTTCTSGCGDRQCGPDPACPGEVCGACPGGFECDANGMCIAPSGKDCIEWFPCANACDPQSPDLQQCWVACDGELSESGLITKNAFFSCQTNDCAHCTTNECLNTCIVTECAEEYAACVADSAHGTGSCNTYLGCRNACPDPNANPDAFESCDNQCVEESSPEGATAAYQLIFCVQGACAAAANDAEWQACVSRELDEGGACVAAYEACVGPIEYCDPATEDCLTCAEFNGCLSGCTTEECAQNCVSSTSEAAADAYDAAVTCLVENCPNGDLQNCNQQEYTGPGGACEAEFNACFEGTATGPCVPADHPDDPNYCLGCGGVLTCIQGCGASEACQTECVGRADADAQPLFSAFIQCLFTECPDGNAQCQATAQQGACADELAACRGDQKSARGAVVLVKPAQRRMTAVPASVVKALRLRAAVPSAR